MSESDSPLGKKYHTKIFVKETKLVPDTLTTISMQNLQ